MRQLIAEYSDPAVFEPPVVEAMGHAFDDVCRELGIGPSHAAAREVVARRIIQLACSGVREQRAFHDAIIHQTVTG